MLPDLEWLEEYLTARLERQRVKDEMRQDMLRRSQDALAIACAALPLPLPFVWHPEPPKE